MDIEGGEGAALQGAQRLLAELHPVLFLATHGPEVHRRCCELLGGLDYELTPLDSRVLAEASELLARPRGT